MKWNCVESISKVGEILSGVGNAFIGLLLWRKESWKEIGLILKSYLGNIFFNFLLFFFQLFGLWNPFSVSFQQDCEAKLPPFPFTSPHLPSLHIFFPRFFPFSTWLTWIFKYNRKWFCSFRTLGCILSCPIDLHSISLGDFNPLLTVRGTLLLLIPPGDSGIWQMWRDMPDNEDWDKEFIEYPSLLRLIVKQQIINLNNIFSDGGCFHMICHNIHYVQLIWVFCDFYA